MVRSILYTLFVPLLRGANARARRAVGLSHLLQYKVEGALRPDAEWFDHHLDVYWQWPARRGASFLERGVLNSLAINAGAKVLELCSGDGFNSSRFYARRSASVTAVDANEEAVAHARRLNSAPNVRFVRADIRWELPEGPFDNVIWDGALSHFSRDEAKRILSGVRDVLRPGGVLSGQTDHEPNSNYSFARVSFPNSESLAQMLGEVFPHVYVRETRDEVRINYHFFCSGRRAALPFSPEHPEVVQRSGGDEVPRICGDALAPPP